MSLLTTKNVPVILGLILTVFAIAMLAGTVNSVTGVDLDIGPGDGNTESGPGDRDVPRGDSTDRGDLGNQGSGSISLVICIRWLRSSTAILAIVGGVSVFMYLIYRVFNLASTLIVSTGVIPVVLGSYFFLTNCPTADAGGGGLFGDGSSVMGQQGTVTTTPSIPPVAFGLGFGLIAVAAIGMLFLTTRGEETIEPREDTEEEPEKVDFAEAAGLAADRIERHDVTVDNAVYRAWLEMTALLDMPNPDVSTPMEFAETAIEFGLDEDDVRELTKLFTEVRYGEMDPATREAQAVEILRNFEEQYEMPKSSESTEENEQ